MTAARGIPADQLAARMIVRALDAATPPNVQHIADQTALTVPEINALVDKMRTVRNHGQPQQVTLRSAPPIPTPAPPDVQPVDLDVLLGWARSNPDHPAVKRLHTALARVRTAATKARTSAAEEERRRRIAQLRAELATLTAQKPKPHHPADGQVRCDCGQLVNPRYLGVHRARSKNHAQAPA